MNINKWKSMAISKEDHSLLKALGKQKFRGPAAMFSKIFNDYIEYQAKKNKMSVEEYKKNILK